MEQRLSEKCFSILLVEPDNLVGLALSTLVNSLGRYQVVATASTTEDALTKIDQYTPVCLLIEIDLPGKSGIELLLELRRRKSSTKPLILSHRFEKVSVELGFKHGALSYVPKNSPLEDLSRALEMACENKKYVPDCINRFGCNLDNLPQHLCNDPISCLSGREREIFYHLADGFQNSAIAKKLFISPRTVETHRARIVRKLGIQTNAELIRYAIRNGLSTV